MKIRIVNKKDPSNIVSMDMSKILMMHQFRENHNKDVILSVTMPGMDAPLYYPDYEWTFQQVQVSMAHKVSYVNRNIPEIVTLYAIND